MSEQPDVEVALESIWNACGGQRENFALFRSRVLSVATGSQQPDLDADLLEVISASLSSASPDELAADLAELEELLWGPLVPPGTDFSC